MTVYVLSSGKYDMYAVDGVFATAELAMSTVRAGAWVHVSATEDMTEYWTNRECEAWVNAYDVQGLNG